MIVGSLHMRTPVRRLFRLRTAEVYFLYPARAPSSVKKVACRRDSKSWVASVMACGFEDTFLFTRHCGHV